MTIEIIKGQTVLVPSEGKAFRRKTGEIFTGRVYLGYYYSDDCDPEEDKPEFFEEIDYKTDNYEENNFFIAPAE